MTQVSGVDFIEEELPEVNIPVFVRYKSNPTFEHLVEMQWKDALSLYANILSNRRGVFLFCNDSGSVSLNVDNAAFINFKPKKSHMSKWKKDTGKIKTEFASRTKRLLRLISL